MENKHAKGFNVTDVPLEVCLLQGEIAEFFTAWRTSEGDAAEELADVALYVLGLAGILNIDLAEQMEQKISKNAARVYERGANGVMYKTTPEQTSAEH
ncbi:MazG-like family protein [Bailinhaonella thermotolerans]|nr:MazG-like family protein [Bailinhaonella thermotolerans]